MEGLFFINLLFKLCIVVVFEIGKIDLINSLFHLVIYNNEQKL